MNHKIIFVSVFIVFTLFFLLCSCPNEPTVYLVTLDAQDGIGGDVSVNVTYGAPMPAANAPTRNGYTFAGYYSSTGGDGTQYYNQNMTSMCDWDVESASTLYADWTPPYTVGGTGPAGGIIFYENPNWETDVWRYLEAAPADIEQYDSDFTYLFGYYRTVSNGPSSSVGTDTDIGTGEANNTALVNAMGSTAYTTPSHYISDAYTADYAAKLCTDHTIGAYVDWFLPSVDEMYQIYSNLKLNGLGGFEDDNYWSSSENGANSAYALNFSNGTTMDTVSKDVQYRIRPARAF